MKILAIIRRCGSNRHKVLTLVALVLYVYIMLSYSLTSLDITNNKEQQRFHSLIENHLKVDGKRCERLAHEELNIYYVKIHKTGSTTFQNILYRLGFSRDSLFFALFDCPFGMTYPHPPNDSYLFKKPTHKNFRGHYNLLTDHALFDEHIYKSYMPNNTKVVTLLRHPFQQLQSTFKFFKLPTKLGIFETKDENTNTSKAIRKFLNDPYQYEIYTESFGCEPLVKFSQTKNPQSHHLGYENQMGNDLQNIQQFVKFIDKEISLVLILERFEESLLLFKRMFCLTFRDILHLNLFSASFLKNNIAKGIEHEKYNEDISLVQKHRKWSPADYFLYDYFSEKLNRIVVELGSQFQEELRYFQAIKSKVRAFCMESCSVFNDIRWEKDIQFIRTRINGEILNIAETKWSTSFNISRGDCLSMMFETRLYDNAIKLKQWPDLCDRNKQDDNLKKSGRKYPHVYSEYCERETYFMPYFPIELFREGPYFSEQSCLTNF